MSPVAHRADYAKKTASRGARKARNKIFNTPRPYTFSPCRSIVLHVPTLPARAPLTPFLPRLALQVDCPGDIRSTICNNTVDHNFNYKFKYGKQSSEYFRQRRHGGQRVTRKSVSKTWSCCWCVGCVVYEFNFISIERKMKRNFYGFCSRFKEKKQQQAHTPPQKDTRTQQHSSTRQHSTTGHNTGGQGATASRPNTPKNTRTHTAESAAAGDRQQEQTTTQTDSRGRQLTTTRQHSTREHNTGERNTKTHHTKPQGGEPRGQTRTVPWKHNTRSQQEATEDSQA